MIISTIKELDFWMLENCIVNTFTPNNRYITDEGLGLEKNEDLYIWYHNERGNRENLEYFINEKEAVNYVFNHIKKDKFANSHLIGKLTNRSLKTELIKELKNRNIKYWNDEIPQIGIDLKEKYLIE